MQPTNDTARFAGALYLLMGLPAPLVLLYIPKRLIVPGDAAATANNIRASETLFHIGTAGHLLTIVGFMLLVMVLYRLLNRVNRMHAALMVIFVLVSIPISLFSVLSELVALTLVRGADYLSVFDKAQQEALAFLFLGMRGKAITIAQIFWGLWLIPFGLLVMRSGFIPRIFGVLLIINGVAYPILSFTTMWAPEYSALMNRITFPALMGELWIMLWFLIKGARVQPIDPVAVAGPV